MFTIGTGNDCFVLVACKYREIVLFFSYKGEFDTFVFHKGVNSIRAYTSSPLVPARCLLFLVTNGNLTLLFFIWEQIVPTKCLLFLVTNCNLTLLFFI